MRAGPLAALVALWVLLTAAALAPWLVGTELLVPGAGPARGVAGAAIPDRPEAPPLESFAAVVERPLFTASRRPPPSGPEPGDDSLLLGRYRLSGVVVTPTRRIVLLREASSGRTLSVAQGERVDDWLVADVTQARIVLESDAGRRVIRLNEEAGAGAREKRGGGG